MRDYTRRDVSQVCAHPHTHTHRGVWPVMTASSSRAAMNVRASGGGGGSEEQEEE